MDTHRDRQTHTHRWQIKLDDKAQWYGNDYDIAIYNGIISINRTDCRCKDAKELNEVSMYTNNIMTLFLKVRWLHPGKSHRCKFSGDIFV